MRLPKFDVALYKRSPEQIVARLNAMIAAINSASVSSEYRDANSTNVIIVGQQPDKTFGVVRWNKQGDQYILVERIN